MARESSLDFDQVPFFKLIYSMIHHVQETVWLDSKKLNVGRQILSFELARVFKSLPSSGDKNLFI